MRRFRLLTAMTIAAALAFDQPEVVKRSALLERQLCFIEEGSGGSERLGGGVEVAGHAPYRPECIRRLGVLRWELVGAEQLTCDAECLLGAVQEATIGQSHAKVELGGGVLNRVPLGRVAVQPRP